MSTLAIRGTLSTIPSVAAQSVMRYFGLGRSGRNGRRCHIAITAERSALVRAACGTAATIGSAGPSAGTRDSVEEKRPGPTGGEEPI